MIALAILLTALGCGGIALVAWQMWRGLPASGLPSLIWTVMIVAPFVAQWGVWQFQATHAAGMLAVSACLFLGDLYATRLDARDATQQHDSATAALRVPGTALAVLAGFTLGMALLHLYLTPQIPMLFFLGHEKFGSQELMVMREESAKLLQVPALLKYVFNWLVTVFSTIGIVSLLMQRRWRLAALWYVLAMAYATMTTAKVPAVLLTVSIGGGILWFLGAWWRKRFYLLVTAIAAVAVVGTASYMLTSPQSRVSLLLDPEKGQWFPVNEMHSLADLWRLRFDPAAPSSVNVFPPTWHPGEYVFYRVILSPVEVANYWYAYYKQNPREGWRGIVPWATPADFVHPARKVGLWAYRSRFPNAYGATINAYASADADAHAHFGWLGMIVGALLLLGFRVSLAWLGRGSDLTRTLSGSAIILFAFLVPQASVQAIFVAQGLVFYPAAMWLARRVG